MFNNVVYDYDTFPTDYYTYYGVNENNEIEELNVSLSNVYNSTKYPFAFMGGDGVWNRRGLPFMIYNKTEFQLSYFTLVDTKNINGEYRLKNITSYFPPELMAGATFKINFQINGKNYKYLTTSNVAKFTSTFYVNNTTNYYIGGYNELPILQSNYTVTEPSDIQFYSAVSGSNIVIDFGNNNQEIPSNFYDWFLQNFDKVYENTYTIKSTTGATLTTLTEAPPMTSATLSVVDNAKYLTLKGENGTNYTMEWTSETPQGKIFAGLATSKGGSIVIPVGETSTINLTDSTDLYELWQTYRPPTTTFDINLYKNSAEPNKLDKTADLSTVGTISGVLRQECSLINPEIIIQYDKPPDFNYCYIANFGRYYYVENIVSMRQNLWRVRLRCDVLMTYKTQILNLTARIARQQYTYSYRQIDSEIPFTNDPEITVEDIPNSLNLGTPGDDNILLTVVTDGT